MSCGCDKPINLNRRIAIQEPTAVSTGFANESTTEYTTIINRWANFRAATAEEREHLMQMEAYALWVITIRPYNRLTVNHRIVYRGKVYGIVGFHDIDQGHLYVQIFVREVH